MRTMRSYYSRLATTVTLGAICMLAWTPEHSQAQIIITPPPNLNVVKQYHATDLGLAVDAGALDNEEGAAVTATFEIERWLVACGAAGRSSALSTTPAATASISTRAAAFPPRSTTRASSLAVLAPMPWNGCRRIARTASSLVRSRD
jgi:hypothetical protein